VTEEAGSGTAAVPVSASEFPGSGSRVDEHPGGATPRCDGPAVWKIVTLSRRRYLRDCIFVKCRGACPETPMHSPDDTVQPAETAEALAAWLAWCGTGLRVGVAEAPPWRPSLAVRAGTPAWCRGSVSVDVGSEPAVAREVPRGYRCTAGGQLRPRV